MDPAAQELITRHNEQIRELIVRDIDALEEKLNVKRQVSMKADAAMDKVKGTLGMNHTKDQSVGEFVRHNAAPLLAVGLGGAILARNARQQVAADDTQTTTTRLVGEASYEPYAHGTDVGGSGGPSLRERAGSKVSDVQSTATDGLGTAKDKVTGVAGTARDKVTGAAGSAKDSAVDVKDTVAAQAMYAKDAVVEAIPSRQDASRMVHDHNQLFGLAALAAGALAGTFVPRSRAEERRIAPVQAQVKEKASDLVEGGVEKAKETAERASDAISAATDAAKEEFAGDSGDEQPPSNGSEGSTVAPTVPPVTTPNRITGTTRTEAATGVGGTSGLGSL